MGQPCGKASWESLVGKPRGKDSWESLEGKPQIPSYTRREARQCCYSSGGKRTCMPPLETRTDSHGETPEVPQDPCQHSRGILSLRHRLHQGLRPQHRRERNPDRLPSNSHGDWPFLRLPERVPEVPVVRRKLLPLLAKSRKFSPPGELRPISSEVSPG